MVDGLAKDYADDPINNCHNNARNRKHADECEGSDNKRDDTDDQELCRFGVKRADDLSRFCINGGLVIRPNGGDCLVDGLAGEEVIDEANAPGGQHKSRNRSKGNGDNSDKRFCKSPAKSGDNATKNGDD